MNKSKKNRSRLVTDADRYVGERIREARIANDMTQTALGELMGVSFQQIQKYEKGRDRVNGGRIALLVSALNRPLTYFFPNVTDVRSNADPVVSAMMQTREGQDMAASWSRLDPTNRRRVLEITKELRSK